MSCEPETYEIRDDFYSYVPSIYYFIYGINPLSYIYKVVEYIILKYFRSHFSMIGGK